MLLRGLSWLVLCQLLGTVINVLLLPMLPFSHSLPPDGWHWFILLMLGVFGAGGPALPEQHAAGAREAQDDRDGHHLHHTTHPLNDTFVLHDGKDTFVSIGWSTWIRAKEKRSWPASGR